MGKTEDNVAIVIAYEPEKVNKSLLTQLHYGIEEEGIPYLMMSFDEKDGIKLSERGAEASKLGVGIGIDGKGYGCLSHTNFRAGDVLFHQNLNDDAEAARILGTNAARLIKGIPFKVKGMVEKVRQAYGFIETKGLTAAITASDIALKAANVVLIGLELTRGFGYTVVKLEGDVSAVKAGIQACESAPELLGKIVSVDVIARPVENLDFVVRTPETIGLDEEEKEAEPLEETREEETKMVSLNIEDEVDSTSEEEQEKMIQESTCNLCHDPLCTRKKGETRSLCLHYDELEKEA